MPRLKDLAIVLPVALAMAAPVTYAQERARSSPPARATAGQAPASRPTSPRAVPRSRAATQDRSAKPTAPAPSRVASADRAQRQAAQPRRQSGSSGGDRAVPRTSAAPDRSRGRTDRVTTGHAVDRSRDRGDRPSYGTAVPRRHPPRPPHGGGGYYPVYPGYSPWWWYTAPVGFGFYYWDPFWWGGATYGYGYPYYGGGGYPYYGGGYAGVYGGPSYDYYGALRLKVKPREAEVYVDGYFAGIVDQYDGIFQRLNLDVGPHRIEIRSPGYESITFEVRIQPDQTITYESEMVKAN